MEIVVVTVWFYLVVAIASIFATALIVRAVRADNRDLEKFEPHVTVEEESRPLAA